MSFQADIGIGDVSEAIDRALVSAETAADVELTAAAHRIAILFVAGIAVDGPQGAFAGKLDRKEYVELIVAQCEETFASALGRVPRQDVRGPSGRQLVTTLDVWHWLASGDARQLGILPYEK